MKLDDIINSHKKPEPQIPASREVIDEEVEKLAEYLEAFAKEDTLLDELAKVAVLSEIVQQMEQRTEKRNG
jgi:predicted house-cleaning noncanonical NTP pyrophosphatase (MazG superfamily)